MKSFIINNKWLRISLISLFWIIIWQLIFIAVNQELLIVSPIDVFFRLIQLTQMKSFWISLFNSILHITEGFILAVIIGVLLAFVTYTSPIIRDIVKPIISIIKATPVASFIILALVWIKSNNLAMFISFLMVLPIIWSNISQGILNIDYNLIKMARFFKVSNTKIIKKIYIPSLMPYFNAACTTGMGFAWKSGCAAEVIGNTGLSIGGAIYKSKIYMDTIDLFAWTTVIVIISFILEKLIIALMKRI